MYCVVLQYVIYEREVFPQTKHSCCALNGNDDRNIRPLLLNLKLQPDGASRRHVTAKTSAGSFAYFTVVLKVNTNKHDFTFTCWSVPRFTPGEKYAAIATIFTSLAVPPLPPHGQDGGTQFFMSPPFCHTCQCERTVLLKIASVST